MDTFSNKNANPEVIVLDVYETMLNMEEIERRINSIMDSKRGYTLWFELFMQYCFVDNCTAQFNNFISIGKATMQMAASRMGRALSDDEIDGILEHLIHLPVHDGIQKGLSELSDHGYRLIALTNAPQKIVQERMERTGLVSYFEMVVSSESVGKYKPCREVYLMAAEKMQVDTSQMVLLTSHGWDIAGGANAGMRTAYLKRSEKVIYPLAPAPDFICSSLSDLARQLAVLEINK